MPKKGQKKRWFWRCLYDKGAGADRECCPASSKKGFKTADAAKKAALKHVDGNTCYGSWGGWYRRTGVIPSYQRFCIWSAYVKP